VVWAVSLGGSLPIAGLSTVVPTVTGLDEAAAVAAIEEADLTPEVRRVIDDADAGTVLRTEPDAGITLAPGAAVTVVISNGPPPAPLMNVANLTEAQARQALESAGFTVGSVTREDSSTVAQDLVISTEPSAGTDVSRGTTISLVLSSGLVQVPNVLDRPIAAATEQLSALGLVVDRRFTTRCVGGDVVEQSLTPGAHPQGSSITLLYCNGSTSRPAPSPSGPAPTTPPPAQPTQPGDGDGGGPGNGGGGEDDG
jgi:beta-lactam-binding protein with PASTA domain